MKGFDSKKFMAQAYSNREKAVPVPDLAAYFEEGEEPVWTVRGLTGNELANCNEASENSKQLAAAVDALASGNAKEVIEHLKETMGMGDDVPRETTRRMSMLQLASVKPEITLDVAVKMNDKHPIEFLQLTNAITEMTGAGAVLGKPKSSGKGTK